MATPFSPFVGRMGKLAKHHAVKRRQSDLPSDLIDWDAPEIPELEKQRIIYEDQIKELQEDHDIEEVLNEQLYSVVHETFANEYKQKVKQLENEVNEQKSKVNLMLGQIKMFETTLRENSERIDELESENSNLRTTLQGLEQDKENWQEERVNLLTENENINFRNNEITCELSQQIDLNVEKTKEVEDYKNKLGALKNQLLHYKKMAKGKGANDD